VWGLLKTFFLKIPKFVWIGCLSRTMFECRRKNKPLEIQSKQSLFLTYSYPPPIRLSAHRLTSSAIDSHSLRFFEHQLLHLFKTKESYIDIDWILLIILTRELRKYINNMLMYRRLPGIVEISLYGLTMEFLRLILVHIKYFKRRKK
jgi:hypothetical protein